MFYPHPIRKGKNFPRVLVKNEVAPSGARKKKMPHDQEANQTRFLEAFPHCISEGEACKRSGVGVRTVQRWRAEDGAFATAYDEIAGERGVRLEEGMFGLLDWALLPENRKIVFQKPTLFIFALKGLMRERYGDRAVASDSDSKKMWEELVALNDRIPVVALDGPITPGLRTQLEELVEGFDHS